MQVKIKSFLKQHSTILWGLAIMVSWLFACSYSDKSLGPLIAWTLFIGFVVGIKQDK
jgi:hypothetical protein